VGYNAQGQAVEVGYAGSATGGVTRDFRGGTGEWEC
jgi:hypothetical protein